MNTIRTYWFTLMLICLLGYSCTSKEKGENAVLISNNFDTDYDFENPVVGFVSDEGEAVLTKNKKTLLERWNKNLLAIGIDGQLDRVIFDKYEGEYFLSAFSSKTGVVSNIGAFEKSGKLYLTTTCCTDLRGSDEKDRVPRGLFCGAKEYCTAESIGSRTLSTDYSPMVQVRLELDFLSAYFKSKSWEVFWESEQ